MCPVPTFQPLSRYDRTLEHLKCKKETLRWQSNQKCSIPVYHPQYLVSILVLGMFGSKMSLDCHRFFCTRKPLSPTMTTAMWSLGLKMFAYTCTLLQVQYTCSNMCRRLQGVLVLASGCIRKSPSRLRELRGFIEKWQKSVLRRFLESWFSGIRAVSPSNQLAKHGNIVRLLKTDIGYHNLR